MIIDISHHEKVTSYALLKKNCPFAISKATEGTSYVDPTLNSFIKNCERVNLPYWLYAFLRKGNEIEQTKFLVNTCKNKVGKNFVGYVLDVEDNNGAQDVLEALNCLEKQGKKCMLYIMFSQYEKYLPVIKEFGKNTVLWEARYGKNDGIYRADYPPHGRACLHQYTDNGHCAGVKGLVDLNRVTGKKDIAWFTTPMKKVILPSKVTYYKACSEKEDSFVDGLKSIKVDSSFKYREKIAKVNGIKDYEGTAFQNMKLLNLLKKGKLKKV